MENNDKVDREDMKIKRVDSGDRLMRALEDQKNDGLRIRGLIARGIINERHGEAAMDRIQRIYELELKKILKSN